MASASKHSPRAAALFACLLAASVFTPAIAQPATADGSASPDATATAVEHREHREFPWGLLGLLGLLGMVPRKRREIDPRTPSVNDATRPR